LDCSNSRRCAPVPLKARYVGSLNRQTRCSACRSGAARDRWARCAASLY